MGMAYDPGAVAVKTNIDVLYVTAADDDDAAFIRAYPSGTTLTELSPQGETAQEGTLAAWP